MGAKERSKGGAKHAVAMAALSVHYNEGKRAPCQVDVPLPLGVLYAACLASLWGCGWTARS